ncbi:MAG: fatty acid hydroxylase, partial [Rhodoferax sp.]
MDFFSNAFSSAQGWLFESLVQPLMFLSGLGNLLVDGYSATGWLLVGLIQIAVLVAIIGPLQRWRPVEVVTDPAAVRTDMLYTV